MLLLCLFSLVVCALSQPIGEPVQNSASYNYAVDFSQAATVSSFKCLQTNGYRVAFVRGYNPTGSGYFDTNAVTNINNAYSAGIGTEVYMTPLALSTKNGTIQLNEMYNGLVAKGITVRQFWIQVTSPINWYSSSTSNINFINGIINRAKQLNLSVGIYTSFYDWAQITNSWTGASSGTGLWYWNVNGGGVTGETLPDFTDFRAFGGWTTPAAKQFGQAESVCSLTVNRDIFPASSMTMSKASSLSAATGPTAGFINMKN